MQKTVKKRNEYLANWEKWCDLKRELDTPPSLKRKEKLEAQLRAVTSAAHDTNMNEQGLKFPQTTGSDPRPWIKKTEKKPDFNRLKKRLEANFTKLNMQIALADPSAENHEKEEARKSYENELERLDQKMRKTEREGLIPLDEMKVPEPKAGQRHIVDPAGSVVVKSPKKETPSSSEHSRVPPDSSDSDSSASNSR